MTAIPANGAAAEFIPAPAPSATQTLINEREENLDLEAVLREADARLAAGPANSPAAVEARYARALILARLQRRAEAIAAFTALARDYPQLPEPQHNLAVLHAQAGDYEQARSALRAVLTLRPDDAAAQENLGDIETALAASAYARAGTLAPDNPTARFKLAQLRGGAGDASGGTPSNPSGGAAAGAASPQVGSAASGAPAVLPNDSGPVAEEVGASALAALDAWVRAWASHDVDAYLAAYAPDFEPEDGSSRRAWERQRRLRIGRAQTIDVAIVDPNIEALDTGRLRVRYTQEHRFDKTRGRLAKVVELQAVDGSWKIARESLH